MANERWDFAHDRTAKMLALGVFGVQNGVSDDDAVARSRWARLPEVASRLALDPEDLVVDLGSGMGYLAEKVAPLVRGLCCVDISADFLRDAKARLDAAGVRNVEYVLTEYASFSSHFQRRVNKIYALLLFIHFNYYDFLYYLAECNRVLEPGGLLYFDFNDGDRFRLHDPADSFNTHVPYYKKNRTDWIFGCMHMASLTGLRNVAPQLGFQLDGVWPGPTSYTKVLLRKVAEAPDLGG